MNLEDFWAKLKFTYFHWLLRFITAQRSGAVPLRGLRPHFFASLSGASLRLDEINFLKRKKNSMFKDIIGQVGLLFIWLILQSIGHIFMFSFTVDYAIRKYDNANWILPILGAIQLLWANKFYVPLNGTFHIIAVVLKISLMFTASIASIVYYFISLKE